MKICWLLLLAIVVGAAVGVGGAILQTYRSTGRSSLSADELQKNRPGQRSPTAPHTPRPKVLIDTERYDFGVMDSRARGRHDFTLTNAGDAPLTLSESGTSCKCTVANLKTKEIPPGRSAKVTLEWTAGDHLGEYHQTATIRTNDPLRRQIRLTVAGKITTVFQIIPRELVFSRISAGGGASGEVHLYNYASDSFEITGSALSDPKIAEYFDVTYEPLPPERLDKVAQSGYLVRVTVKSGLPRGLFRQKILLNTNTKSTPTIEVPVEGTIGSDISVLGRGWNDKNSVLTIGVVGSHKGAERTLSLVVRGPHRKEVEFKPIDVFPELLEVRIGKTTSINNGVAMQTPLTIRIPKGNRPANHLGSKQGKIGRIILQTNHPQVPELKILVKFAVEGG
jgi:hypothetical protein